MICLSNFHIETFFVKNAPFSHLKSVRAKNKRDDLEKLGNKTRNRSDHGTGFGTARWSRGTAPFCGTATLRGNDSVPQSSYAGPAQLLIPGPRDRLEYVVRPRSRITNQRVRYIFAN